MKQIQVDTTDNTGMRYEFAEVDDSGNIVAYKRQDGYWDIPVELDLETIACLAIDAHQKNLTLNELVIEVLTAHINDLKSKGNENANS
jgi:predicted HicB family RNase H-like nuclease